jgi:pimeloyl-ACP methyl ester carboxylesterase
MERVASADGTEIAYEKHRSRADDPEGERPPAICLHGTGVTRHVWGRFLEQASATPFVVPDRRGRGDSGDTAPWAFERELEDVAALAAAEAPEGPVTLVGSSFGGLLAMRATRRIDVDRLVLYEPPMPAATVEGSAHESLAAEVERRIDSGDRESAVRYFFEEATGASGIEQWPIWPDCVALAESIARECHVVESFDPSGRSPSVPTLLFQGDYSPAYLQAGIDVLDEQLPDTRVVEVQAGHAGVAVAPGEVGTAFDNFVESSGD